MKIIQNLSSLSRGKCIGQLTYLIIQETKKNPTKSQLLANYPNPFNPKTWIPFKLVEDSIVSARIYDVTGKQIRIIKLGHVAAGNDVESSKAIHWDGKTEDEEQVSSGNYFYQIAAGSYIENRKIGDSEVVKIRGL